MPTKHYQNPNAASVVNPTPVKGQIPGVSYNSNGTIKYINRRGQMFPRINNTTYYSHIFSTSQQASDHRSMVQTLGLGAMTNVNRGGKHQDFSGTPTYTKLGSQYVNAMEKFVAAGKKFHTRDENNMPHAIYSVDQALADAANPKFANESQSEFLARIAPSMKGKGAVTPVDPKDRAKWDKHTADKYKIQ